VIRGLIDNYFDDWQDFLWRRPADPSGQVTLTKNDSGTS
jgi:hypothetical protein